jgi:signal transduction histidine kinase
MKRLSVKGKVTLLFSVLLLSIIAMVCIFMYSISGKVASDDVEGRVAGHVERVIDEVESEDDDDDVGEGQGHDDEHGAGDYEDDEDDDDDDDEDDDVIAEDGGDSAQSGIGAQIALDDDVAFYGNGVYIGIYDEYHKQLMGQIPPGWSGESAFIDGSVREIKSGGETFFVYDKQMALIGGSYLWVRGVGIDSGAGGAIERIIRITLLLTPLFLFAGALGGYFIIRKAFREIERIQNTADDIRHGGDLTKRIGLPPGDDEVHRLAGTFDEMFDRLEESFEGERRFTSDASHELRTPVSVILAQCEYALGESRKKSELISSFEVVQRQAERMSGLIASLLQMTRMDSESLSVDAEDFDFSELVEMATGEVKSTYSDKLDIACDVEPGIFVRGDRSLILRLVLNLSNNACQYTPEGGSVRVRLRRDDGNAVLSVEDTGVGIAAQDMEHIWDRFYMVSKSRTADGLNHTGLGLSMVKQIAEAHGGKLGVISAQGQGSVFTFSVAEIA